MNILAALRDGRLLGGLPAFRDLDTWRAWLVFVKAVYGLPMPADELLVFQRCTGRERPRPGGYPEAVAVVGVQSGKTRIASALADHAALTGEPGTFALALCQDHRASVRVLLRYMREPFEALDAFRAEVTRSTADAIELRSGVTLAAYPCRPEAVRGLRACVVVIDELAFFTASDGRPTDTEMLRVARGRLATTGGKLIVLSSPYGQTGALWELHRRHYGREDSPVLVWQASAPEMNPTLPGDYLQRMEAEDPEAYRSEVLGEFRQGLSSLLDPDALDACVEPGVRERPRQDGHEYVAHYDASGGRRDAASLAIAHRASAEAGVLDLIRRWAAPHNPELVIAEAAAILKSYRLSSVQVDRFGGDFPVAAFRRHGIDATVADAATSDNYLALVPLVNAARVLLLDEPVLLRELRGLDRRRGNAGRDRVDHRPGAHDDTAAAATGALCLAIAEDEQLEFRVGA